MHDGCVEGGDREVPAVPVMLPRAQILVQKFEPEIPLHRRRLVLDLLSETGWMQIVMTM